jgi:hypothetical protein
MSRRRKDDPMTRFTWLVGSMVVLEFGLLVWIVGFIRPLG